MPENAIVAEEAVTSGRALFPPTFAAPPHDWLQLCGGAICEGLPLATGAAVACPDRKVICLEADGSGMYSLQSLWTQAREKLDVVNVILQIASTRFYRENSLRSAPTLGKTANDLLDLGRPNLDWVSLARGMGVEGSRVETLDGFADVFRSAVGRRGPFLIEMVIHS